MRRGEAISEETLARMMALRAQGAKVREISAAVGVGQKRTGRILRSIAATNGDEQEPEERTQRQSWAHGSMTLIAAIRRHHPEKCGVAA